MNVLLIGINLHHSQFSKIHSKQKASALGLDVFTHAQSCEPGGIFPVRKIDDEYRRRALCVQLTVMKVY